VSLRRTVAAAFRERGDDELPASEFVVALSLDRGWFSPDQAQRFLDVAAGEGLVAYDEERVRPTFNLDDVHLPEGFEPDEDVLRERSTFERVLDVLIEAGHEKQAAVAAINRLQSDLEVTIEAAAVVYARREGITVEAVAEHAITALEES